MSDAVDISFWSGELTEAAVACWKARGVRRVIVGLRGLPSRFLTQARACLAGGLEVEAYLYLYWGEPGGTQGQAARVLVQQVPEVRRVWLDAETDGENPVTGDPEGTLRDAAAVLAGYQLGIYTSRTMWQAIMADSAAWSHLPLWDAGGWRGTAFYAYGGWTSRAMHQYTGTVSLCGVGVDLNDIEEAGDMTAQQVQQLNDASANIIRMQGDLNGLANAIDVLPGVKGQLKYLYALAGKPWPF